MAIFCYFQWPKSILYFWQKCLKTLPFEAGHTHIADIRECPPSYISKCRGDCNIWYMCSQLELSSPFSLTIGSDYTWSGRKTPGSGNRADHCNARWCISTNPPHPGTSHAHDIKTPALHSLPRKQNTISFWEIASCWYSYGDSSSLYIPVSEGEVCSVIFNIKYGSPWNCLS